MSEYVVKNISRAVIHDNLATRDEDGKLEVFVLQSRESATLSADQWASPSIQKHITSKRLRSKIQSQV